MQPLRTSKRSLSSQAQQYLLDLIQAGTYRPGQQLPSEVELAAQLGISRPTLREALRNLELEGAIVRKHGVGTFVSAGYERRLDSGLERLESILELASRQGMDVQIGPLQVREEPAEGELVEALQVEPATTLTSVDRVILVDGVPVAYMSDYVPSHILPVTGVDRSFDGSVLDLLRQKGAVEISHAVADIIPINADASLAAKLGVKQGRALLLLEEILFDIEGAVVEFSRNYFVPDLFRFHVVRR